MEKTKKPAIRFDGFTEDWELYKVADCLVERNEQSPQSNEYPLMAFIANEGIVPKGERYDRSSLISDAENKLYKRTEFGDFIYSSNNLTSGSIGLNKYGKASISPVYSIFYPSELAESDFIGRRFVRDDFISEMIKWRQGVVYGQWRIHESDFVRIDVHIPQKAEQIIIGKFLDDVDGLIFQHQQKYDKLLTFKKSMLEKLFPQNGAKEPEMRFAGFAGEWELHSLKEIVKEINRNDPTSDAPIMMITASNGFIEQSDRYSFDNAGDSLKKYILLKKGELAYNHGASKLRPYGSCFALTKRDEARIPFVYHCFSAEGNNPEFLSLELNGADVESQLRKIVSSGARMDGLLNISFEEYTSVSILLPKEEEQNKIADFFRAIEELVSLYGTELEKLKNIKSALLEKMFV